MLKVSHCLSLLALSSMAVRANAQDPANDRLTLRGEFRTGRVTVTKSGTVYYLKFRSLTENLEYRIDVGDPNVRGGMIRVYEASSDCFPISAGGVLFRDWADHMYLPTTMVPYSVMSNEYINGNSVVLEYTDSPYNSGVHHRRHTYTLSGKVLGIKVEDMDHGLSYLSNYAGIAVGSTQGTEDSHLVQMQGTLSAPVVLFERGTQHWFMGATMDLFQSNACDWLIPDPALFPNGANAVNFSMTTGTRYYRNTSGQISAPMNDTWNVAVSQHVADVLIYPTQAPSPYRELLEHRTVVLLAQDTGWNGYKTHLQQFNSWGLDDIAAYCFSYWTASATDLPAPGNQGPDWFPAKDATNFTSLASTAKSQGDLLGVYTSFSTLPLTAPSWVYNASHIARTDTGANKLAVQLGAPLLATTASGIHAHREAQSLKQTYGLSAAYLDIQSYAGPGHGADGDHVDQLATSPWAKTSHDAFLAQKLWMQDMTDTLEGPMLGEGSIATYASNTEWMWAGYCDSVQRVINTGNGIDANHQAPNDPHSPTLWPVIPEYELRVAMRTQANHGNGFYDRFFSRADGAMTLSSGMPNYPLSDAAMDRYRMYELTYGHTSFFMTSGPFNSLGNFMAFADMIKEYYLGRALQSRYLDSSVSTIKYYYQGALQTFEQVIFQSESTDSFRNPKLYVSFANGLEMYLNHSTTNWVVTVGGVQYTIPEDGFVAYQPTGNFVAFSAIAPGTGGYRVDYCYAPGEYEFFDGRNFVNGYGNINTGNLRRVKVENFVRGITVQELGNGTIQVTNGTAPSVTSVDIVGQANILTGDRRATKAIAHYSNGAFRDVTTLVNWSSSNSNVASINNGGALIGAAVGQTTISTSSFQGVSPTPFAVTVD